MHIIYICISDKSTQYINDTPINNPHLYISRVPLSCDNVLNVLSVDRSL